MAGRRSINGTTVVGERAMTMTDLMWDDRPMEVLYRERRLDSRVLQHIDLPAARAFTRGYDRIAVDDLLGECAETIDLLTSELRFSRDEVEELRRQSRPRATRIPLRTSVRGRRRSETPARARRRRSPRAA